MKNSESKEWLRLKRTVRFGDTDAAGVIHFYNLFRWCHEAWEESLELYGISANEIFPKHRLDSIDPLFAFPIVYCEANFFEPLYVGDCLDLQVSPKKINSSSFSVSISFIKDSTHVALGKLKHISIDIETRKKSDLSAIINAWLEASI